MTDLPDQVARAKTRLDQDLLELGRRIPSFRIDDIAQAAMEFITSWRHYHRLKTELERQQAENDA